MSRPAPTLKPPVSRTTVFALLDICGFQVALDGLSVVVGLGAVPLRGFSVISGVADSRRSGGFMRCRNSLVGFGRFFVSSGHGAVRRLGAPMGVLCALGSPLRTAVCGRFTAFKGALAASELLSPLCGTLSCCCGHAATH